MSTIPRSPGELPQLLEAVERRERRARRRAVVLTLVPVAFAGILLAFTGVELRRAQEARQELTAVTARLEDSRRELETARSELAGTRREMDASQQEIAATRKKLADADAEVVRLKQEAEKYRREASRLQEEVDQGINSLETIGRETGRRKILASALGKFAFEGELDEVPKFLSGAYAEQARLLSDILDMRRQGVRWTSGGQSPRTGFDSAHFAEYLLEKHHLLSAPASGSVRGLRERLPPRQEPRIGDVVFYGPAGPYGPLFYFRDEQARPFVIGMTQLGILALRPDFDRVLGYGGVAYPTP